MLTVVRTNVEFSTAQSILARLLQVRPTAIKLVDGVTLCPLMARFPEQHHLHDAHKPGITEFRIVGCWSSEAGYKPWQPGFLKQDALNCFGSQLTRMAASATKESWAIIKESTTLLNSNEVCYYVVPLVLAVHAHAENLAFPLAA